MPSSNDAAASPAILGLPGLLTGLDVTEDDDEGTTGEDLQNEGELPVLPDEAASNGIGDTIADEDDEGESRVSMC